jgi:hypothetical protein
MVWVKLNNFEFEAEKFETRTMPTPDLKGKEVIYWIKIKTPDKRLAIDLGRFMDGAPKFIDLRVPSALIAAKTEVETFRKIPPKNLAPGDELGRLGRQMKTGEVLSEKQDEEKSPTNQNESEWRFEIILRRTLPAASERQTQSPYG